jgi:hypothetical protein
VSPPPGPKSNPAVRMGDVAGICLTVDRIDAISAKLDRVIATQIDMLRRLDTLEAKGSKAKR